jgi:hypothetical protein
MISNSLIAFAAIIAFLIVAAVAGIVGLALMFTGSAGRAEIWATVATIWARIKRGKR